jgi:hypothetical protein
LSFKSGTSKVLFTVRFRGDTKEFALPNGATIADALKQVSEHFKRTDIWVLCRRAEWLSRWIR